MEKTKDAKGNREDPQDSGRMPVNDQPFAGGGLGERADEGGRMWNPPMLIEGEALPEWAKGAFALAEQAERERSYNSTAENEHSQNAKAENGSAPNGRADAGMAEKEGAKAVMAEMESAEKERGETPDLNAMLAGDKGLQSQFDKLVGKALATAKAKWEREKDMTAEQLAEEKAREREAALSTREQALHRKELRAEAMGMFGEKGIPVELIDCVSLADAESMATSVAKAESAFRKAVDRAVRDKLTGVPPQGSRGQAAYMAQFRAAAGIKNVSNR